MIKCKLVNGGDPEKIREPKKKTVYGWIRKEKDLCLRKVTLLEADRIRASTQENIGSFFNIYEADMEKYQYKTSLIV